MRNLKLKQRICEISYRHQLSHLGSVLTAVDLIYDIYTIKKDNEPFILSAGHAFLALAVVLEDKYKIDAEKLWLKHGTHPNRDVQNKIDCSTGSLGQGLPIAVGMALANRTRDVFCLTSDGEMCEGSMWEALRFSAEQKLENLKVVVNCNGFGAYSNIDLDRLQWRLGAFIEKGCPKIAPIRTNYDDFPFLKGVDAHYYKLTKENYELVASFKDNDL